MILQVIRFCIYEFDINGLRFDTADVMEKQFFTAMHAQCTSVKRNFWLMEGLIYGDYRAWANNESLNSVTNYECYKGLWSSHNDKNYFEIAYSLNRRFGEHGICKGFNLYNFADNHDVDSIRTVLFSQTA